MSQQQPPQGFFGASPAGPPPPPPPPRKSKAPLIIVIGAILFGALLVIMVASGMIWLTASTSPDHVSMKREDVPADGKRYYRVDWQVESAPTKASLRGVWASTSTAHAVGDGGIILTRSSGGTWSAQSSGTRENLHAVASTAAGTMAVGDNGTVVVFDRATRKWNREDTGSKASLRAILRLKQEVLVAGSGGTILRRSRTGDWSPEPSGVNVDLHALARSSRHTTQNRAAYAVGADGTILFHPHRARAVDGGSAWVVQDAGTKAVLLDVIGDRQQLLVVGKGGASLRLQTRTDTPWAALAVPGAPDLAAVGTANVKFRLRRPGYGESGSEPCWIVAGKGGFVAIKPITRDEPWHVFDPKPTTEDLHAVSTDNRDLILMVGEHGTIVSGHRGSF